MSLPRLVETYFLTQCKTPPHTCKGPRGFQTGTDSLSLTKLDLDPSDPSSLSQNFHCPIVAGILPLCIRLGLSPAATQVTAGHPNLTAARGLSGGFSQNPPYPSRFLLIIFHPATPPSLCHCKTPSQLHPHERHKVCLTIL